jgi:hypothetical protein
MFRLLRYLLSLPFLIIAVLCFILALIFAFIGDYLAGEPEHSQIVDDYIKLIQEEEENNVL